jgi:S-formylglutathione hydrolase FrmB
MYTPEDQIVMSYPPVVQRALERNRSRLDAVANGVNRLSLPLAALVMTVASMAVVLTATSQSSDTVWESEGYGLLIRTDDLKMTAYQVTSVSCLRWWSARRVPAADIGAQVFDRGDAKIRVSSGPQADLAEMQEGLSISHVILRRIAGLPSRCDTPLADTPLNNYSVFWQTFAEQFALFPAYRVDWNAVDRKQRARITASTTPEELFDILREMIRPFHNAHTNINAAAIGRQYLGYRPASPVGRALGATSTLTIPEILALFKKEAAEIGTIVNSNYSVGPLRTFANDMLRFGVLRDSIGYLQILAFDEYSSAGTFEANAAALDSALDAVVGDKSLKALILDVRVNTGGADPLALAIASRLTASRYLAYSKITRINSSGSLRFSAAQSAWVDPSRGSRFLGPVALLIGPDTLSGGETFAMALMERRPTVMFVGENTQGVFSDVWGRRLPNGWTFGVPTELYLTKDGKSFDAKGVPPHVRAPALTPRDVERGRDPALEAAVKALKSQNAQVSDVAPAIVVRVPSAALGREQSATILLPSSYSASRRRYPVLYLLHGGGQDHTAFAKRGWFRAQAAREMIVVTPTVGDSWYVNSVADPTARFEDFVANDLIAYVDRQYRTVATREGRAVAGVSMGAWGAMLLGLKHPQLFGAIGALSAPFGISRQDPNMDMTSRTQQRFGAPDTPERRERDPASLVAAISLEAVPMLYLACGSEDMFVADNRGFVQRLTARKIPYEYRELSPFGHSWDLWDPQLVTFIEMMSKRWGAGR